MKTLKLVGFVLAVLAAGVVGYKLAPSPVAETKTVYVDRVQVVEKVVTKDVVRTVTKPDGTKIVTTESTHEKTHVDETDKSRHVVVGSTSPAMTRYSLGIGIRLDPFNPLKREYEIELGKRLWQTPLWVRATVRTDKTVSLGLSYEF